LFFVPSGVLSLQLALAFWAHRKVTILARSGVSSPKAPEPEVHPHAPARTQLFLRMAWIANPFAYIAINTVIAVVPGVAKTLGLSAMTAGFCCSVWCFARLGAFTLLWLWDGWHYRFRWLLSAYIGLILSFAVILMIPNLRTLVVAQLVFGTALGVLYYSSLFYSMDLSDVKSEHGGIHEAIIGVGNMTGPAVGAAALHFLPQYANSGSIAVSGLLVLGLGGLLRLWYGGSSARTADSSLGS
jgi:hypothetical protein